VTAGREPLAGRRAVVSGASSGIGLATALALHDRGATVHALARRREAMEAGAGEERLAGGRFHVHAVDVTDAAAVGALAELEESLDVLVAAAGVNIPRRRLHELTPESWDGLVATNLSGVYYLAGALLPALRAARGRVIVVGSVSGAWPDVSGPAYQAAKAGALAFVRGASLEERERGVTFTCVMPGVVDTAILDNRPEPPTPEQRAQMLQAEDVAAACVFAAGLPARAYIPELTILPVGMQALGATT
jgi:NADP-dependent 3-hydroxy acid dehydrogenase YdfG